MRIITCTILLLSTVIFADEQKTEVQQEFTFTGVSDAKVIKASTVTSLISGNEPTVAKMLQLCGNPVSFKDYGEPLGTAYAYKGSGSVVYLFQVKLSKNDPFKENLDLSNSHIISVRVLLNGFNLDDSFVIWTPNSPSKKENQ